MLKILAAYAALTFIAASPAIGRDTCVAEKLRAPAARGRVVYLRKNGVEDPIPNASLELRQMEHGEWVTVSKTSSDERGHFDLQTVKPGKYELLVNAPQMDAYSVRLQVLGASGTIAKRKEVVVALAFLFMGCGDASVRKVKQK